ncbi:hypothetical protein MSG28_013661 [Choristoneura fumiferana]|uniref:Uncharacterized protein n=1 Tax=Choristoneura fumiferana TaxID=7141 RepID=A0ACC0K8Z7_CHOFU|nr:hypothetical protein MSG28_013661 [Choristoneura fumiferana]
MEIPTLFFVYTLIEAHVVCKENSTEKYIALDCVSTRDVRECVFHEPIETLHFPILAQHNPSTEYIVLTYRMATLRPAPFLVTPPLKRRLQENRRKAVGCATRYDMKN